tara:strand:+ start:516 stop:767 length:252 start_codon:yes stop_codon:yes gene_type:complete
MFGMTERNGLTTMSNTETLPEKINVIRSITYDVPSIVDSLKEMGEDINIDSVMEYIEDWVSEDMASPISRHDITYLDENGQEL